MPEFTYSARDFSGNKVVGTLEAATQREVLAQLDNKGLFPLEISADAPLVSSSRGVRIKGQHMATLYAQLADLLRSGVPLLRSLEVLRKQSSHPALSEVLDQVRGHVEEGNTLAEAMARYPRTFSELAVSVVRAGGEGGFLAESLEQIATFTERQEDLKSRTLGAVAYPAILAGFGTIVVFVLVIFFVPKFETLFTRLRERGELPALTEWLLWTSNTLQTWWPLLLAAVLLMGWWIWAQSNTETGRLLRDRINLRLPLAGTIYRNLAVARFCRVLGTLLRNGVPILRSLEIGSDSTGNRILSTAIQKAAENISAGESLAKPLIASRQFPPAVVEMIAVAEESNTLDKVLVDIAEGLERRTWRQLELAVRLLEPLLLLCLSGVVLMLVIALLLPIIKMSSIIS